MRSVAFVVTVLVLATLGFPVWAQALKSADRAAAQVLFDEGRKLSDAGAYRAACRKFEESMRLHPATGTQLNLARCYERTKKLASAWINWVEAKQRATVGKQPKRAALAKKRAEALEGRISFLTIRVAEPVDGLTVLRDGSEVGQAQWGSKVPSDKGTYLIEVSAPGYVTYKKKVRVEGESANVVVEVPALEPVASTGPVPVPAADPVVVPPSAPEEPVSTSEGFNYQGISGVIMMGLGVAGLGVGIGFGVAAGSKNDESLALCPDVPSECTSDGVTLREDAFTLAHVSTAGFIGGGLVAGIGIILLATSFGGDASDTAWMVTRDGIGVRW